MMVCKRILLVTHSPHADAFRPGLRRGIVAQGLVSGHDSGELCGSDELRVFQAGQHEGGAERSLSGRDDQRLFGWGVGVITGGFLQSGTRPEKPEADMSGQNWRAPSQRTVTLAVGLFAMAAAAAGIAMAAAGIFF